MKIWEWFKRQQTGGKIAVVVAALFVALIPISAIGAAIEGDDEPPKRDGQELIREGQEELRAVEAEQRREDQKAKAKQETKPSPKEAEAELEEELTAEYLVDLMEEIEPATIKALCRAEDSLGEGIVFAEFQQGYTDGDPSAEEVFEEVMDRC